MINSGICIYRFPNIYRSYNILIKNGVYFSHILSIQACNSVSPRSLRDDPHPSYINVSGMGFSGWLLAQTNNGVDDSNE